MKQIPKINKARRIVIKIGSALLVDGQNACIRQSWLQTVVKDIVNLRMQNCDVLVVSSGAIALARYAFNLNRHKLRLAEKQAAAAIGQIKLAQAWSENFLAHDITTAQILLTLEDTETRLHYLNARSALETLLKLGCIPIINENDTVATSEIRFGDNDRLAARVAEMVGADQLILLSDIDGLYTADPKSDTNAQHLPIIEEITPEIMAMGGKAPSGYSSGGMATKLAAGNIATTAGCAMAIAFGKLQHPLKALQDGARCSWFLPNHSTYSARKRWIAGGITTKGIVYVDHGAEKALHSGKSLLPVGIIKVEGYFQRGDLIKISNKEGLIIGSGVTAYDSSEINQIIGLQTGDINASLGWEGPDEVIHHDDMVLPLSN
ncbi:glutamate 5-kinase [Commensalibacter papalotli (ex Botero et al. 2024)]|uniref:Glutamate 5-kinase n=1 Tax=Commensalibacter papalotli (ex Botero et al. 2024) TaxID=2972766 RepID=A0ABM9HM90_9PROT|nr:glutamate 5-kinase [Commensalibacter papalotli (ex Botero et al. 2024)]CAI3936388.1 Glutamate 5-kinase (ProB) (PDB:2W21) [Commensalibacter papalotli (ex Botero et al. 2024)]CAI3939274.1 Glutamate 5-kinase (ProB) (PDB:2W21) [Commensalibacter papalotli (ex Botero et al. 2024)]